METLVGFICCEVWCLIGALFLLVGYRILTGGIKTSGLFSAKDSEGGLSPARIQLLVLTLANAFYYLAQVTQNAGAGLLPGIPKEMLLALGGSNALYVGSKAYSQIPWFRNRGNERK